MVYCFTSFHLIVTFSPRFTITWEHWLLRATSLVLPHRTSSPEIPQPLPDLGTCHHLTWVLRFDSAGPEDEPQEGRLGFKAGLRAFLASVQETEVLLVCRPQVMRPWRQKGEPWRFPLLSGCLGFLHCQSMTLGKFLPVLSPVLCLLREHTPGLPASYGDGGQEYSVAFKLSFPTGLFPSSPSKSVLQPVSSLSLCDPTRQTQYVCSRTFSKAFTLFRHQLVPWFGPSSLFTWWWPFLWPLDQRTHGFFLSLGALRASGWEPTTDWRDTSPLWHHPGRAFTAFRSPLSPSEAAVWMWWESPVSKLDGVYIYFRSMFRSSGGLSLWNICCWPTFSQRLADLVAPSEVAFLLAFIEDFNFIATWAVKSQTVA